MSDMYLQHLQLLREQGRADRNAEKMLRLYYERNELENKLINAKGTQQCSRATIDRCRQTMAEQETAIESQYLELTRLRATVDTQNLVIQHMLRNADGCSAPELISRLESWPSESGSTSENLHVGGTGSWQGVKSLECKPPSRARIAPRKSGYSGPMWLRGVCADFRKGKCDYADCRFAHLSPEELDHRKKDFSAGTLDTSVPARSSASSSQGGSR